jgi:hypothetical protein
LIPITVIATASAAYNALKKGIEIGRELQDMSGQLAAWAGAVSDLDFLAKKAEAPAVVRVQARTSKRKPWRSSLRREKIQSTERLSSRRSSSILTVSQGGRSCSGSRPQVRKRKQATDHRKAEIKEMLITITIVTLVLAAGIAGLALLAYLLWASQQP